MQKVSDKMLADTGTMPAWDGSALTSLAAGNMTAGGAFPAIDGSALTNLPAGGVAGISSSANETAISIDANETVTMPKQPCFFVKPSATASNVTGSGGEYDVNFDSEIFDQGSNVSVVSGVGTFTASVTGRYLFIVSIQFADMVNDTAQRFLVRLFTSNRNYSWVGKPYEHTGANVGDFCFSVIADMDVNDTATVRTGFGGMGIVGDVTSGSYLCGALIA